MQAKKLPSLNNVVSLVGETPIKLIELSYDFWQCQIEPVSIAGFPRSVDFTAVLMAFLMQRMHQPQLSICKTRTGVPGCLCEHGE